MLAKLAFRNVKRQFSNYLIYFVTVTLTISLMFALCNVIFSEQITSYASAMKSRMGGLIAVAVTVSLVVSFVLGRASSFMLRLRKREFGTYLTLGMKRRQILLMFTAENLFIGAISLVCGILFGLFVYQGLVGIIAGILDFNVKLGSYSSNGLLLTCGLTVATYILSAVSSALYLGKVSVYELLHGDKKVSAASRHPMVWTVISAISLAGAVFGIYGAKKAIYDMFSPGIMDTTSNTRLIGSLALMFICIFLLHSSFAKGMMSILLKSSKIKSRGTNCFVLRELSSQLGTNSVICGIIALLISAVVLCTNVCLGEKALTQYSLFHDLPFDARIDNTRLNELAPYSVDEALNIISEASPIVSKIPYTVYTTNDNQLHKYSPWNYEGLYDSAMPVSTYNSLITYLGYEPVKLNDSFIIVGGDTVDLNKCDFTESELKIGEKTYTLDGVGYTYPSFAERFYFLAVVPDEAEKYLTPQSEYTAIDLLKDDYDSDKLNEKLSFQIALESGAVMESWSPVALHALYVNEENSMVAVLIVGELYVSIIFIFLATAILTMKLLSDINEEKKRYELLYKLGVSEKERKRTLFRQTFTLFAFPMIVPLLTDIPIACVCAHVIEMNGYFELIPQTYKSAALTALVLTAVQLIYFCATYYTRKKNLI